MFAQRRIELASQLPTDCIALFFSGKAPYKSGDEKYPFSVNRNFFYLTGLDKENMVLLLSKHHGKLSQCLCIERYDENMAHWVGGRMLPEEAEEISDIEDIYWLDELQEIIAELIKSFTDQVRLPIYGDFTKQEPFESDQPAVIFIRDLLRQYPQTEACNAVRYLTKMRMKKDEMELTALQEAIAVTKEALEQMMLQVQPEMGEHQVEACFDFVLKSNLCERSFASIIASGENATILHYQDNDTYIQDGDLVLCDVGAAWEYRNADITRTFPANGKFTPRQRELYDIVLKANQYMIQQVKPGITLSELNTKLLQFYEVMLPEVGLLKKGESVEDYDWHSVSHMLGLDTHDVSLPDHRLEAGNVITIEPGLYCEAEKIGIRIEDDILVTNDGCINLSADIIKEADEIEAFMQQA